ncbi:predicted protein [Postia placenta Mad-698-R]|nr:predicted protein [Postia placenta Mad-698-R]
MGRHSRLCWQPLCRQALARQALAVRDSASSAPVVRQDSVAQDAVAIPDAHGAPAVPSTRPAELLEHVLLLAAPASPTAPAALARTCRAFAALVYAAPDQHLWRGLFLRAWDDPRACGGGAGGDPRALPGTGVVGSREAAGIDWGREYRRRVAAQRWFASARADAAGAGTMGARDVARAADALEALVAASPQTSSLRSFAVKLVSEPFAQHANAPCPVTIYSDIWLPILACKLPRLVALAPRLPRIQTTAPDRAYVQPALLRRQSAPGAQLNGEGPSSCGPSLFRVISRLPQTAPASSRSHCGNDDMGRPHRHGQTTWIKIPAHVLRPCSLFSFDGSAGKEADSAVRRPRYIPTISCPDVNAYAPNAASTQLRQRPHALTVRIDIVPEHHQPGQLAIVTRAQHSPHVPERCNINLRGETSGSCHMVAVMEHMAARSGGAAHGGRRGDYRVETEDGCTAECIELRAATRIGLFFMTGENRLQPLSRPWQLYKTRYRRLKGALRDVMTEDLRWPTDIARTNLSKIGGCDILDNLLSKWRTGSMRFELLDPARRPVRLELRRHTRSDAGHSHVFADKREPMKRKRRGHKVPKSALIIENSDAGSDADAAAGGNIGSGTESADEDESRICKRRRLDLSNDGDQYGNSSALETIEDFSSDARSLAETIEDADDWDILILPIVTLRGIQNCVVHPVFDLHFEQQQVLALDALKDEVACLLLAKLHSTIRRYIELAIKQVRIFLLFDILLHREDVPFDNIDACMQQHPALTYSVLKHYLPAGLVCLPDVMAPLATFIMHNVIPSATHFRIAALAALERLAEDLARIDRAAYFGLLWSVALAAGEGVDVGAARCYVYKAALRTVFDCAEEAADACLCDELGRQWRQCAAPMFTRRIPPKAKGDADAPVRGVASPEERAGLTVSAGTAVLDVVVLCAGKGDSHY